MKDAIEKLEDEQQYQNDHNEIPPSDIVAYNELRSCFDLLRLYESKQLDIQPLFQRDVVWKTPDQTRFIDSLTKQLPIPSMCFSYDYKTEKRIVIDGLQRMQSIINFLSDDEWMLSKLDDIDDSLSGKTVHTIKTKYKHIYDRVQNVVIPVTVIRCDTSNKNHSEYLFTIFHRLNSGGLKLNNQEIRNCIYSGSLNDLLRNLAKEKESEKLFRKSKRFSTEEMILRFFAFTERLDSYSGKLSKFLNDYMSDNRDLSDSKKEQLLNFYVETIAMANKYMIASSTSTKLGKTYTEGLLYGIGGNISKLKIDSENKLKSLFNDFMKLPEYKIENLKEGLSNKDKVKERLVAASRCFAR